ncbi:MAG: sugar ABC transporter substrate-binding protein [Trueperaceae bacterium]
MKRIFALLLATLVLGHAFGQGRQTLRFFLWDPTVAEIQVPLIEQFEEIHGVDVEVEALPPDQYWPRMSALAAAGQLPDVYYMSSGFVDTWQSDGMLANLQPYVDETDLDDYFAGVLSTARFPDKQTGDVYAWPVNWQGTVLFYNIDAFEAAGVPLPHDDWTWEEFLAAAQAMTVDDNGDGRIDQYGFWLYGRYAHVEPWIYQNGGDLLSADRTRLEVDESAREALQFLSDLVNEHEVAPPPSEMEGIRQQDVFPLGMAAMWVDGTWNIENNRDIVGDSFRWGITKVPRGPQGTEDIAYTWPDMFAISPTSEKSDLAWEFVKFMTGPERSADLYLGGTVPFYRAAGESEEWLERDQQPVDKKVILELGLLPSRTSFTPSWGDWRGYAAAAQSGMNGELDQVFNGQQSLEEAIDGFVDYGNQVLSRVYPNP